MLLLIPRKNSLENPMLWRLQKKKQQINDYQRGFNELEEERRQVNQQAIRTPGRRGEVIKKEEIEKEFTRRYKERSIN